MDRNALVNALMEKLDAAKTAVSDDINMLTTNPQGWAADRVAKYLPTKDESSAFTAAMLQGGDWYDTPYAQKLMGLALMGGSGKGSKPQTVRIPVADEFFEGVGLLPKKLMADIDKLYRKHPGDFPDAQAVQNHLTYVFGAKPNFVLRSEVPTQNLVVREASGLPNAEGQMFRSASADFTASKNGNYWVRNATPMDARQVAWKLIKEEEGRLPEPMVRLKKPQDK